MEPKKENQPVETYVGVPADAVVIDFVIDNGALPDQPPPRDLGVRVHEQVKLADKMV